MPQRFDERRLSEYRVLSRKVGERIKQARTEDGFTQEDIAKHLDRSVSWLSFIEKGTNMPNLMDLITIANYLGRPIDYFLSDWNVISAFRAPKTAADWQCSPESRTGRMPTTLLTVRIGRPVRCCEPVNAR